MSLPAYVYRHATAPDREQPKQFTDALLKTGRFYRDFASNLHFKLGPDDFTRVGKGALRELLLSGEFVRLEGDTDDAAFDCLWSWVIASLWRFPRLDPGKPASKPLPVSRTGPAYVHADRVRR